ncbi:MAG: hypothetical protein H7Y20_03555 [Bryobacteraceae bacterium]|nr:hypothetical protein [Bryobacteraceae bacterium]
MKLAVFLLASAAAFAQDFAQRGTLEFRGYGFPDTATNDSSRAIGETLFRYEFSKSLSIPNLKFFGETEMRVDTHRQTERRVFVNFADRISQRPAISVRRASLLYNKGRLTVEAGKQFIRWGKADILNPTDRFAPKDFLAVVDTELLAVLAGRAIYEGKSDSVEIVVQPRFTPARLPLRNQRWTVTPPDLEQIRLTERKPAFPGGSAFGARWNHVASGYEASLSFYNGHHYLPLLDGRIISEPFGIQLERIYPQLRLYGADIAVPLKWFTLKGEAAWFKSGTALADEYILWVVQAERQFGEASIVAGYAGEEVTKARNPLSFAPDRGLAKSFLGRAAYTIDPRRSVSTEFAIRQNGAGVWTKFEYTQTFGQHLRALAGFTIIRGDTDDFLGQYRRNSHAFLILRYSF